MKLSLVIGSTNTVFSSPGWTFMSAVVAMLVFLAMFSLMLVMRRVSRVRWCNMEVRRSSKLKVHLKVSCSILHLEFKTGMASSSIPDPHNLLQAAEEESLLSEAEVERVGGHFLGQFKSLLLAGCRTL